MQNAPTVEEAIDSALRKQQTYSDEEIAKWWDEPKEALGKKTPRQYVADGNGVALLQLIDPSWK